MESIKGLLAEIDGRLPGRLGNSLDQLFERLELTPATTDLAGLLAAWSAISTFEASRPPADWQIARVGALLWIERALRRHKEDHLPDWSPKAEKALVQAQLKLGEQLSWLGRKSEPPDGRKLWRQSALGRSIEVLSRAEADGRDSLDSRQLSLLLRTRGVAKLQLAPRGPSSRPMLEAAVADLEEAHWLGETSVVHMGYLRNALVRLYEAAGEPRTLVRLAELFDNIAIEDRQAAEECARVRIWEAQQPGHDPGRAVDRLLAAIEAASAGLALPPGRNVSDGALLAHRGFARFGCYNQNRRVDVDDLMAAIEDLRRAASLGARGPTLINALLALSYRQKDASPIEAIPTLAEAASAAEQLHETPRREKLLERIAANKADCDLRIALQTNDTPALLAAFRKLLSIGEEKRIFALPLYYAARRLADVTPREVTDAEVREVIACLDSALSSSSESDEEFIRFNSHAASLLQRVAAATMEAHDRIQRMIERSPRLVSALHFAHAGDVALRLGREARKAGDQTLAAAHFIDAREWLSLSLSAESSETPTDGPSFDPIVSLGRLGDACLHHHSVGGPLRLARHAIGYLERARALGNETPELLGRLADAHFRLARYERDATRLRTALSLRDQAGQASQSREHWSVSAAICTMLYELEGEPSWLTQATDAALQARRIDAGWPWPLLQLAKIADVMDDAQRQSIAEELQLRLGSASAESGLALKQALETQAVALTIKSEEFTRNVLGGRSKVFVVEDPHQLLSTTLVLKPTTKEQAHAEMTSTLGFSDHLMSCDEAGDLCLPEPIAVHEGSAGRAIYAMRRRSGPTLAEYLNAGSSDEIRDRNRQYLRRALKFLAHFHSWKFEGEAKTKVAARAARPDLEAMCTVMSLAPSAGHELRAAAVEALPFSAPLLAKKDAHPENWLISDERVVMLDLESTGARPLYFEVVQLLEDFPSLPLSKAGWSERMDLTRSYEDDLISAGVFVAQQSDAVLVDSYAVYWAMRCGFGIGRARRKGRSVASATIREARQREEALFKALEFLANCDASPSAKAFAQLVLNLSRTERAA